MIIIDLLILNYYKESKNFFYKIISFLFFSCAILCYFQVACKLHFNFKIWKILNIKYFIWNSLWSLLLLIWILNLNKFLILVFLYNRLSLKKFFFMLLTKYTCLYLCFLSSNILKTYSSLILWSEMTKKNYDIKENLNI